MLRYDDEKSIFFVKMMRVLKGGNSSTTLRTTARERRQGDWLYFESQLSAEYVTNIPHLWGMEYSGSSVHNPPSSQLATRAEVAKLTVPAKVEFPRVWRKISILIVVGGYDCGFIAICVSSFSFSFLVRNIFSALAENHSVGVRD